jgi:nucleoid-associated protein YgaU
MFTRLPHCLFVALLFTLHARAAETAATGSLLPDGTFESDANNDQWPDGWGRPKSGGSWQEEGGNHFLRLTSGTPGEMVMLYQPVKIPANVKAIELTFKWRVSNLKKGKQTWFDARIMMDFKDAEGKKLKGAPAPNTGRNTDGWVERSVTFLVPEGAQTLDFMPTLFNVESGTFDLDDVVMKATDPVPLKGAADAKAAADKEKQAKVAAAVQAKAASDLAKGGLLIPNGNFETESKKITGSPEGWGRMVNGLSWETEEGNHFIRLKSVEPGKTTMIYRLINIPAGTKALELSWRWRITDLKPGKEGWFDARFMMEWKDAAGRKLPNKPSPPYTRNNTQGWVEKKTAFLVPEGAVSLEFIPSLFQVQKGTLDIDDLVLRPTEPEALIAAKAQADAERKAAEVPVEKPQRDKWPQELHVKGKEVLTKDGKPVWLQGVNVVSLEWSVTGEQVMKASLVATEQWGANIIRLPVAQKWWFGTGAGQKDGGASYRQVVDDVITLVANRGKYVLLDLHQFGAPRQEHADFWKDAAAKYKDHPAVIFDLFNEPHGMTWEVWRNGGEVAEKKKAGEEDAFVSAEDKAKIAAARHSIGMQKLLDTVRETGAKNVVLVGGLDYAYDLSGIANGYALKDTNGANGIILSTHIYPWKKGWQEKVLIVADKYPILVGEVGAGAQKMNWLPAEVQEDAVTWVPPMLGFIQKYKLHWTAFAFHPKAGPAMLEDWSYTPNAAWGIPAKRALAGEKFGLDRLR